MNCKHSFTHKDTETRAVMRTWHRHMLLITSSQNVTYITEETNNSITDWSPAVSFYIRVNAKPHDSGHPWVGILVYNSPRWLPRSRDLSRHTFRANVFSVCHQLKRFVWRMKAALIRMWFNMNFKIQGSFYSLPLQKKKKCLWCFYFGESLIPLWLNWDILVPRDPTDLEILAWSELCFE